jgi:2-polyprenyl-3-methyl-5-hydroxy-6-metoxy-1,4-benzoquinol methylase
MDATYAADRVTRPHLAFRYQSRALMAARGFRKWGQGQPVPGEPGPRVLDMGAAEGRTMAEVHRLLGACESIGIEFADSLVAAAGALPRGCKLHQGDVTQPHEAAAPGTFDLVTALAVLEHLDDLDAFGRQVSAALRPGGVFVASCPSPMWDKISGSAGLHKDEHHTCAFDRDTFYAFARRAGLEPLEYRRFMFAPVGFLPYAGIRVSARFAAAVDRALGPLPGMGLMMVNQLFVAKKPRGAGGCEVDVRSAREGRSSPS